MYISYNNILYKLITYKGKKEITTYFKEKCDSSFMKMVGFQTTYIDDTSLDSHDDSIYYFKEISIEDTAIQNIFDVDFVLTYVDVSETTKHGKYQTR